MPVQRIGFYVVLAGVTLAFVAVLLPFYSAILWAVIFAIVFFPLHMRLERRLRGHANLAAGLSVLICVCLVIVPGLLILSLLFQQASAFYAYLQRGEIDTEQWLAKLEHAMPTFIRDRLHLWDADSVIQWQERISSALLESGRAFAGQAWALGQNTLQSIAAFGIMLYLLFFLFRDGRALRQIVWRSIPLNDRHTRKFISKFTLVVRAIVRSNVIIAVVQALIGGVAFWALGLRPALLWSVAMGILSFLPALGTAIVWGPAAVYLAFSDQWAKAVILVLVGVLVIGLVDNLLRPPLIGQEIKLPDYVVLISTLGGITLLGMNGFVMGPLIAALFISFWSTFIDENSLS